VGPILETTSLGGIAVISLIISGSSLFCFRSLMPMQWVGVNLRKDALRRLMVQVGARRLFVGFGLFNFQSGGAWNQPSPAGGAF